jgi:hypothetical protein
VELVAVAVAVLALMQVKMVVTEVAVKVVPQVELVTKVATLQ